MRIIILTSAAVATVLQGCVLPDWIPEDQKQALVNTVKLHKQIKIDRQPFARNSITNDADDMFTRGIQGEASHYAGVKDSTISLAKFAMAYSFFGGRKECMEHLTRFYIRRPEWFFPSADELRFAQECVLEAIAKLAHTSERTDAAAVVASALSSIGPAVYAAKNELALQTPRWRAISDRAMQRMSLLINIQFREARVLTLLNEAINSPFRAQGFYNLPQQTQVDLQALESSVQENMESASHASDLLDQFGYQAGTLKLWKSLYFGDAESLNLRLLALGEATGSRPDLRGPARNVQEKRLAFFKTDREEVWRAWRGTVGRLFENVWYDASVHARVYILSRLPREIGSLLRIGMEHAIPIETLFDVLHDSRDIMCGFNTGFAGILLTDDLSAHRSIAIPRDYFFPDYVATLLYMFKVCNDPLAVLAIEHL